MGLISLHSLNVRTDERISHLPNLDGFYNDGIKHALSVSYSAANTPLPYIIIANSCKLFGVKPDLIVARFHGFIFGAAFLFIFSFLIKQYVSNVFLISLSVLFYPYFIKPTFSFYLSIYGLLFFALSYFFLLKRNYFSIAVAGFFCTLAILSQQVYLFLPFWFMFLTFLEYRKNKIDFKRFLNANLLFNLFLIFPIYLFFLWGGLTNEHFRNHSLSFGHNIIPNMTGMVVIFGSLYFPLALERIKSIDYKMLISLAVLSLFLCLFFSPIWNNYGGSGQISGYTYKVLDFIRSFSSTLFILIESLLAFSGLIVLYVIFSDTYINSSFKYLVLFSSISLLLMDIFSERYFLHVIIILLGLVFFVLKEQLSKRILSGWFGLQGLIFYWYWIIR